MAIYRGTGSASTTTDQATIDEVTTQATDAANSATSAASSASSAASSASSASSSASTATTQASAASSSASAASTSASNASTSATNAATSATAAAASATTAASEATNAETAETGAVAARTAAEGAQTAAEAAQVLAEAAQSGASTSAASASASASTATTKAGEASASATAASNAQTAAEAAQAAAEAAQAAIDGTYLGALASNPTGDGNGNPVTVGDWYFNTTSNQAYIYNGSTWDALAPDLIGDATPQLGGNLDTNGNDISFGDNDKIRLGDGDDLQIYHDGSHSYIKDNGTGNLLIQGSTAIVLEDPDGNNMIYAEDGGPVYLYSNGSQKLATTSTGIDVTGTVTADGLTVDGDGLFKTTTSRQVGDKTAGLQIEDTGAGGGASASFLTNSSFGVPSELTLGASRGSAGTPTAVSSTDRVGVVSFAGSDGTDYTKQVAAITARAEGTITADRVPGRLEFYTAENASGSALKQRMQIANNGDISFYEDTGNTAKFFWDASAERVNVGNLYLGEISSNYDKIQATSSAGLRLQSSGGSVYLDASGNVGIGTSSPSAPLTVQGGTGANATIQLEGGSGNDNASIHSLYNLYLKADSSESIANRSVIFQVGSTEVARFDSSGALLVGTNDKTIYNDTADEYGFVVEPTGEMQLSANNRALMYLNRQNGDGDIIDFRYNGAPVGSIGVINGDLVINKDGGNVGIGTNPSQKFEVYNSATNSQSYVVVQNNRSRNAAVLTKTTNGGFYTGTSIGTDTLCWQVYDESAGERMRLDASGNVGLGVTPSDWVAGYKVLQVGNASWYTDGNANTYFAANTYQASGFVDRYISSNEAAKYEQFNGAHLWSTASSGTAGNAITWSEAMRIDSNGSWMLGTTSSTTTPSTAGGTHNIQWDDSSRPVLLAQSHNAAAVIKVNQTFDDTSNRGAIRFYRKGTEVGSIFCSTTATTYNTSSDYRLKENVVDMTGAVDRVKALNPSQFNFIADPDRTVDGFLAHEVSDVVPEAVTGTKDAMRTEEYEVTPAVLDDDGNVVTEAVMGTREVPEYQGIDQSKLVPLLTGALQEAIARIETLEAEVATLKGN